MKNWLLAVAAAGEAVTGLVLLVSPPIVVRLLFGAEIAGAGIVMSRIAGLALIALGVACGPFESASRALYGMLTYSSFATLYLLYLALNGKWNGSLLWPAVVLHAVLTLLLARVWVHQGVLPGQQREMKHESTWQRLRVQIQQKQKRQRKGHGSA